MQKTKLRKKIFVVVLLDIDIKHVYSATECVQWKIWRLIGLKLLSQRIIEIFFSFVKFS